MRNRQSGFAIVELGLILVIVGIIAFVAWRVIEATGDADNAANMTDNSIVVPNVPEAKTTGDLDTLQNQLNDTQVDDNTTSDLETQTSF